ncbi:MAG: hypothetical protein D3M94_00050 [Rhodocyclales bacterium GT-UBC]|nr:MAG: hypothetical protein D3M94_00050 [Rhodocyclales bacterium GT-UBC]
MEDRRTINLMMQQGEARQLLLETGSTLLVLGGRLELHLPSAWLAEQMVSRTVRLEAEQAWVAESGGWVDLLAAHTSQVVVIPPDGVALWRRVGRCLEALIRLGRPAGLLKEP